MFVLIVINCVINQIIVFVNSHFFFFLQAKNNFATSWTTSKEVLGFLYQQQKQTNVAVDKGKSFKQL